MQQDNIISDQIVFCRLSKKHILKGDDLGAYFEILEYDKIGYLINSEIHKYEVNLTRFFNYEQIYPMLVLDVYDDIINLSYNKLKQPQLDLLSEAYKSKIKLNKLIDSACNKLKNENIRQDIRQDVYNLIHNIITPHEYQETLKQKKNIIDIHVNYILENINILYKKHCENSEDFKDLLDILNNSIIVKPFTIIKSFKLLIYEDSSLDLLKHILNNIHIICVSSPTYNYTYTHVNYDECINNINKTEQELLQQIQYKSIQYYEYIPGDIQIQVNREYRIIE